MSARRGAYWLSTGHSPISLPVIGDHSDATILCMPFKVDHAKIREFKTFEAFYSWLSKHHDTESEIWIKIHKQGSGLQSINAKQAIDACLCWGWIDGIRKSYDSTSFLQRYTPRAKKSLWSKINVENVSRLMKEGRMTAHGLAHVNAAKADGRWERAYQSGREMKLPDDLLASVKAEPKAQEMLQTLNAQNRYALAFRLHNTTTEAGRKKKVQTFVEMLKRGETIHPKRTGKRQQAGKP
jgi:uncharacterized protein YdeI (YjbR/CyaY-like superfamily)